MPRSLPGAEVLRSTRRSWFRLLALLLPVLLLGAAEMGLRLTGYGYATSFFLRSSQSGQDVLVENPRFGWRFFPPAVARSPQPLSVLANKPPGTLRVFVLGESAAMGDPEPAYGFARQLQVLVQARHPEKTIEVVNVAMTAISSHVIREIARDCARQAGDIWLVYAGNNEVVGPFGAGTVFGRQAPPLSFVRLSLALKSTRLGQLLCGWVKPAKEPAEWEGMEMFLQQQVSREDPRLERVYENFAGNLAAVIEQGQHSGAKVLVATMPVNLRDCPPFGSKHRAGYNADGDWEKGFARGQQAERDHRFAEALAEYQQMAQMDGTFAELIYRRARCELMLNQREAANTNFRLARDLDTLRFRADSRLNAIIRETAAAKKVTLIDAEQACEGKAGTLVLTDVSSPRPTPHPKGREGSNQSAVPGEELFYDHVHLNFAGNYLVATLFAAEVEKAVFGPEASRRASWLSESEVARRLAFTDFDRRRVGEEMRLRLQQAPFVSQSNFQQRDERWQQMLGAAATPLTECLEAYRQAVALAPQDWVLQANYARVLEAAEDAPGVREQWLEVARLMPHEPDAWFQLGDLAYGAGNYAEARRLFQEALQRQPDCTEALNGLGLVYAAQGQNRAAIEQFEQALRLAPRSTAPRVNLAVVLANSGEIPAAKAQYQLLLRQDTNNVGARVGLAKLLAGQGEKQESMTLYREALQLQPDDPVIHYDLGKALAEEDRHAEALPHYAAAVQARPGFAEARYSLALEMTRLGRGREAVAELAEVVRLKPEWADAHYNYGIALAKEQRFGEAVQQFQETLRLQPGHAPAQTALQRALQLTAKAR